MPKYKSVRGTLVSEEEESKLSEVIRSREEEYLKALGLLKEKEALEEKVDAKEEQKDQLENSETEGVSAEGVSEEASRETSVEEVSEEEAQALQEPPAPEEREKETQRRGRRRK